MSYHDPENGLYCTEDYRAGVCTGRVCEAACEIHFPSDAAEPADDFSYDYPDYADESQDDYPSDYMQGYDDAKQMHGTYDQFTFSVPKGVTFTLTVTG